MCRAELISEAEKNDLFDSEAEESGSELEEGDSAHSDTEFVVPEGIDITEKPRIARGDGFERSFGARAARRDSLAQPNQRANRRAAGGIRSQGRSRGRSLHAS